MNLKRSSRFVSHERFYFGFIMEKPTHIHIFRNHREKIIQPKTVFLGLETFFTENEAKK